jgi:hypothetical protein
MLLPPAQLHRLPVPRKGHKLKFNRLAVLVLLVFAAVPLSAQINDTWVIPAAANAAGANGTRWATELHLFNPSLEKPLKVRLVYLPTGVAAGKQVTVTLQPNMTGFSENVLAELFDITGTGALLVASFPEDNPTLPDTVFDRSFIANSRTFNNASSGTFGQAIPGGFVGLFDYDFDNISAVAHGIRNTGTTSGFRTNIGAVNLGDATATLRVYAYDSAGRTVLDGAEFILPPNGHFQDRLPAAVDHGSVEFFVEEHVQDDAVVFPYASVIDNRSGDPIYVEPVLLASPGILYKMQQANQPVGKKINLETARRVAGKATLVAEVEMTAEGNVVRKLQ